MDEMLADFWAHAYYDDPKTAETVEDEDFDADDVAAQIGYSGGSDPDDWEELNDK